VLSLGDVLSAPSPRQVEDLKSPGRNRQRSGQLGQEVVLSSIIAQGLLELENTAAVEGQPDLEPKRGPLV